MFDVERDADGVGHVMAVSGGKDSTAMALACMTREPRHYTYVITPTGNEPPEMFAHWRLLGELLGKRLVPIIADTLGGLIQKQMAIPNHRQRWCTRLLKLEPYYGWLAEQAKQGPIISYVGLRADEESRPGMIFPDAEGIHMDFPMQRWGWTLDDVLGFVEAQGIKVPERTDCMACFWQKLGEWYLLWRDNLEAYMQAEGWENYVSGMRGTPYTFRSKDRDSWPASLKDLRLRFEAGDVPTRSLQMMDKRRLIGACRICTL